MTEIESDIMSTDLKWHKWKEISYLLIWNDRDGKWYHVHWFKMTEMESDIMSLIENERQVHIFQECYNRHTF